MEKHVSLRANPTSAARGPSMVPKTAKSPDSEIQGHISSKATKKLGFLGTNGSG